MLVQQNIRCVLRLCDQRVKNQYSQQTESDKFAKFRVDDELKTVASRVQKMVLSKPVSSPRAPAQHQVEARFRTASSRVQKMMLSKPASSQE